MQTSKRAVQNNSATTAEHNEQAAPNTKSVPTKSKKAFMNQYNNAKYLAFPEKTFTQHILNVIFDPKAKITKPQRLKVNEPVTKDGKDAKGQNKQIEATKSPTKAATKTPAITKSPAVTKTPVK